MTGRAPQTASASGPPFTQASMAELDAGILPSDQHLLLSGATGLPPSSIDTRLPNATTLPNGPYQLTPGIPYDSYAADPVHRFFQMWQQMDCSVRHASADNPSGCLNDLFAWVEVTVGRGSNGKLRPAEFSDLSTGEGSTVNTRRTLTPPQVRPIRLISCGYSAWQRSQRLHLSRPLMKRRKPYWIKRFDQRGRGQYCARFYSRRGIIVLER